MAQSNRLKTFIRVDSTGKDVSGSNVLRIKMPVTGRWRESSAYLCCNPYTFLSTTPADVSLATIVFTLACDAVTKATGTITPSPTPTVTIEDVVGALNTKLSFYGLFSVAANGADIELRLVQDVADGFCADGTLTFTIT